MRGKIDYKSDKARKKAHVLPNGKVKIHFIQKVWLKCLSLYFTWRNRLFFSFDRQKVREREGERTRNYRRAFFNISRLIPLMMMAHIFRIVLRIPGCSKCHSTKKNSIKRHKAFFLLWDNLKFFWEFGAFNVSNEFCNIFHPNQCRQIKNHDGCRF